MRIVYAAVFIFWLLDIFNASFMVYFDNTLLLNGWFWTIAWIVILGLSTKFTVTRN